MREGDLITKVVTKNIPLYLVKDFIMKEGNTLKTTKDTRKLLKQMEKAHYMSKKHKTQNNKEKNHIYSKEDGPKENPLGI